MLKIENVVLPSEEQWKAIIRGMRNPKNSWDKSDSGLGCYTEDEGSLLCKDCEGGGCVFPDYVLGPNDLKLMTALRDGGPVHAKYRRMITVYLDITAPLYWWKEYDTYKVGTVANSCSTMHKIHDKEFTLDDFSHEHLMSTGCDLFNVEWDNGLFNRDIQPMEFLNDYIIHSLNVARKKFLETNDKKYWWQMIQLLPSSYNQKRTVMLNYEVLANIYRWRRDHKLDEWHTFCDWIEGLPYSELITGKVKGENNERTV